MRRCTKCGAEKEDSDFQLRPSRKSGFFSACRECNRKVAAAWKGRNLERTRELSRKSAAAFFEKFPDRVRENAKRSINRRLANDPEYRILHGLRRRLNKALHGLSKSAQTKELLGCSPAFLRYWLELQFRQCMTWENYGLGWHIDHKKPCASFSLSDPEQQKLCFHYSNLQPLWAKENISKGCKVAP